MTTPLPADADALRQLIDGYRNTALIYAAAKLRLPDLLASGPATAAQLAARAGVQASPLARLLRGLAVIEIVKEDEPDIFSLTSRGAALCAAAPGSAHARALLAGEEYQPAWSGLAHSVRTGENAFQRFFGQSPWQHRETHPELGAAFNTWLREETAHSANTILASWDFATAGIVVDLGGGYGGLLTAILIAHPHLQGILCDLPHVAEAARQTIAATSIAARCSIVGGDLFLAPPPAADTYLLKSVLHDWDDDSSLALLRQCRTAMPPGSRLLIIERLCPQRATDAPATVMLDLHMLAVLGGRERSEKEYVELAELAGLSWQRTIATPAGFHLLEFHPTSPSTNIAPL